MPDIDLLSAEGGAGIDEGWFEGSLDAQLGVTVGLNGSLCHGIDVGASIDAIAEARAAMRLLVLGGEGAAGAQASAGVRGRVTLTPDLFDSFGLNGRIEAAAEVAAWARLGISLQFDMIEDLASDQLNGLALELFRAFLIEVEIGGGVMGKVAYSAMARGWVAASGSLAGDDPGFVIGGGYAVGLKGGTGMEYFLKLAFENPRRFFVTAADLIIEHVVDEIGNDLPPLSDVGIELLRLLVPVGLVTAYDIGRQAAAGAVFDPAATFDAFLDAFSTALQKWIADKAAEAGAGLFAAMVDEALMRLGGVELTEAQAQQLESNAQALVVALNDGQFDIGDLDELVDLASGLGQAVSPELADRFERPAGIMWTAAALSSSLRDVARAYVTGGDGVDGTAQVHAMPLLSDMPAVVRSDYERVLGAGFDPASQPGASLSLVQALDYLNAIGIEPLLRLYVPGAVEILDRLEAATGASQGQVAEVALYGVTRGGTGRPELYTRLADFVRSAVVEVVRTRVFEPLVDLTPNPAVTLYVDEVLAPSLDLMVEFIFGQLDELVDNPSGFATSARLVTIRGGASALLYKVIARNLVVIEQILTQVISTQSVMAFQQLQTLVRSDAASELVLATVDHVDEVLESLSDWVPGGVSSTGLTPAQLAAIQTFAAEMLDIAQALFGPTVFTPSRLNRKRITTLKLMLSFETEIDWTNPDILAEAFDALQDCSLSAEAQAALTDLLMLQFELLVNMGNIVLERVPGPLAELVLALTSVDLEELEGRFAAEWARIQNDLAELAGRLAELSASIAQLAAAMAAAVAVRAAVVANWVSQVSAAGWTTIRTDLIRLGEQFVDEASAALGIADVTRDAWKLATSGAIDLAGVSMGVVIDGWADAAANRLAGMAADVSSTLSGVRNADAGVSIAMSASALSSGIDDILEGLAPDIGSIFIPNPADPSQSVEVSAQAIRGALVEAFMTMAVASGVAANVANYATAGSRHARAVSRQNEEQGRQANLERQSAELRSGGKASIHVSSPASIAGRLDRLSAYGPQVPVLVRINGARAGWPGNRIQVALNGRLLSLPSSAFVTERRRVTLDWEFELGPDGVSAGLNVLEISVLIDDDAPLRETVSFMVDPSAEIPNTDITIDASRSQFDAPGNDHEALREEYVALRAGPGSSINLRGWRLADGNGHTYHFRSGSVGAGRLLRVRTGGSPDEDTKTDVHWGRRRAVWNNRGDTALLIDDRGVVRAQYVYGGLK